MTQQQIINVGTTADDGQGDTLREGFIKTNDNFDAIWAAGPVNSNVRITDNTITTTVINSDLILSPSGVGFTKVQSDLNPVYNNIYELGSAASRWETGYFGTGGLDVIGPAVVGGNLTVNNLIANSITFTNAGVSGNLTVAGNSILGNTATANYFVGDGSFLTNVAGTVGSSIVNGTSNVNIAVANGNIVITSAGTRQWTFSTTGNLTAPGNITTTANVSGAYILGNGSQLTGIDATSIQSGNSNVKVYANANVAISSAGNANILVVTGTGANIQGTVSSSGNANVGNLGTAGLITATGNITGGNLITAGFANIGTTLSVIGNAVVGNLNTGGLITATGNVTGNFFIGNGSQLTGIDATSIQNGTSNVRVAASGNVTFGIGGTSNVVVVSAQGIAVNNTRITGLAEPEQNQDAATKNYVDSVAQGLDPKASVNVSTTTALGTYTYNNGTAGVGATITGSTTGVLTIDGQVVALNNRVLVKNEPSAGGLDAYNGIYLCTTAGAVGVTYVLTRSTDFNQPSEMYSAYTFTEAGTTNADTGWVCTNNSATPITVGTTPIVFTQFSGAGTYTANTSAGLSLFGTVFSAKVDDTTTAFDGTGNIVVKASANLTTPNIGAATGTSLSVTGNVTGDYILGNGTQLTGILGSNVNMGSNTSGSLISNAVTLTTTTTVTNGIALLNQVLGKLVPPAPPNFPNATTISLSGIATYRMANITQVDNTPGANRAVAAGTSVANVLRVATYATNTIANVGPGDAGTIIAVRNGANVGNVTLNTNANPSANGTYGGNLVISNNFDYNSANANIASGFWYVFSSRVSGTTAAPGWNELYIADTSTGNTNTTVWYYDNSSPSTPSFSSTTMTPPGSANLLYSSTIPHYTNNNNFTIAVNIANISGNTYPTSNTLASGSSGGAFAAPASINYNSSNIGSNVLNSFASASANTTSSITTGFGGSSTGPSMSVNNSYSTGTLTLTAALGNTVLWKSGTATSIDEGNVVINTTIGTGSGNAYRIINPGTGNNPAYTGSEAAFNSQTSTLQSYDATVVGSGSSGLLKHDQTNYSTGYLPAGPDLSSGRSSTQYFTIKFVRTAVSKFDIKYSGNVAGMWVALPGSVIDSSSSANGWISMSVAYGGAGYPGVNSPGNGSDGCAVGGIVTLNTSVTNNSKTCTFGTVSSSSTATNEIYVRIALTAGQSVTALTLETASN